jgi:hypothetical protein
MRRALIFAVPDELLLVRCGQASNFTVQNRPFQFEKRSQLFRPHTTKRFPSSRCASAIQIVRPQESTAALRLYLASQMPHDSANDRKQNPRGAAAAPVPETEKESATNALVEPI